MKDGKEEECILYGIAKIGEKGQIVIPKEARAEFDLKPGDKVIILGKKGKGLGIAKATSVNRALAKDMGL
jgi:AbrB family looped-hinge helix DNA binding protein